MTTFYLPPEAEYVDDGYGVGRVGQLFPNGLYDEARSAKQARLNFRMVIARMCGAKMADVDFDPNRIVQLG